jgi:hypothetical protein
MVSTELGVITHDGRIHSNEFNQEGIHHKFHLNVDCNADNFGNAFFREAIV